MNGNQADNSLPDAGAVYVFARGTMGQWTQQAYLKPDIHDLSSDNTGQAFGGAVTVQGNTVVAGSIGEYSDHLNPRAWVFTRSPAGVWTQQQALTALVPGQFGGRFGYSFGLSGDTLVVGEPLVGDNGYAGDAHVFTRNAGVWTRQAVINPSGASGTYAGVGFSVALDGGTFVVGTGRTFWGNTG